MKVTCACANVYKYIHIRKSRVHAYMQISILTYTCMHKCIYIYTYTKVTCACIHANIYIKIHMHAEMYIYIYIRMSRVHAQTGWAKVNFVHMHAQMYIQINREPIPERALCKIIWFPKPGVQKHCKNNAFCTIVIEIHVKTHGSLSPLFKHIVKTMLFAP